MQGFGPKDCWAKRVGILKDRIFSLVMLGYAHGQGFNYE